MTAPAGDTSESKVALRRTLRAARQALSPRQRRLAARRAALNLLRHPVARDCRRWGLYLASGSELDTLPLLQALWRRGAETYVPVIRAGKRLHWVRLRPFTPCRAAAHGIRRPCRAVPRVPARALQLLVLPLVGFDRRGTRLGAGGGYYDRVPARPFRRPLRVGFAYHQQGVKHLPRDPWDLSLDRIATDRSMLWPTG